MTTLVPYVSGWIVLALVVLGLALYRKFVSAHEEDRYVHIAEGEAKLIPHQIEANHKIATIDRWGEILTVFTLVGGLALACIYVCQKL